MKKSLTNFDIKLQTFDIKKLNFYVACSQKANFLLLFSNYKIFAICQFNPSYNVKDFFKQMFYVFLFYFLKKYSKNLKIQTLSKFQGRKTSFVNFFKKKLWKSKTQILLNCTFLIHV